MPMATFQTGSVRRFIHHPDSAPTYGLVLTHGAGGNCSSPLLVSVSQALCDSGIVIVRFDLPFRQRRPSGPPSPATAGQDREALRHAVAALRETGLSRIVLGGHSYGGRQATILASEQPGLADALLLLSYPLHPPNKPEQRRTGHFPELRTPALFVHGSKDPFGSFAEMREALKLIPAKTELIGIEGAGHDLARGKFDTGMLVAAANEFIAATFIGEAAAQRENA